MTPGNGRGPGVTSSEATATTKTASTPAALSTVDDTPASSTMDGWERRRGSRRSFAERTSATRRRWTRRRDAADRRIGTTPPSEHSLDAWVATLAGLQRNGTTAVMDVATLRALWLRGGPDRRLAEQVHAAAVTE
jgi:hypothetical protein